MFGYGEKGDFPWRKLEIELKVLLYSLFWLLRLREPSNGLNWEDSIISDLGFGAFGLCFFGFIKIWLYLDKYI